VRATWAVIIFFWVMALGPRLTHGFAGKGGKFGPDVDGAGNQNLTRGGIKHAGGETNVVDAPISLALLGLGRSGRGSG
jgi:hypothetical protein